MKNSWFRRGTFVALCLVASAALGNAAFSGPNPNPGSLLWNGFSDGSVGVTTNFGSFNAGQFQGYFDPTLPAPDAAGFEADDFFRFFCVDLAHLAVTGPGAYTRILGLDGSQTALDAAELTRLFNQFYPNGATGTYYNAGITNFGDFATAQDSAAFQLAVWEIWFDNDMNLSTGTFTATASAVRTQAQGYLNAVGTSPTPATGWTLYEFVSGNNSQNYISVQHTGPLQQAPEPGTLILLGAGALAAWGASKRNRKTA